LTHLFALIIDKDFNNTRISTYTNVFYLQNIYINCWRLLRIIYEKNFSLTYWEFSITRMRFGKRFSKFHPMWFTRPRTICCIIN